MTANKVGT